MTDDLTIKIAKLETKVDFVIAEIQKLQDGTYQDIASLKRDKADRKELESIQDKVNKDIEVRMRGLEETKVNPQEHKSLLESMNTNNIYLKWFMALIVILIGVMSAHILGFRIP